MDAATTTTGGSGSSNGVNYAYTLQTKRLSGRYECHIHRYLLDSDTEEFMTDAFPVAGFQWQLAVKNKDGRIVMYLKSANAEPVEVRFNVQLANYLDWSKTMSGGTRKVLEPGSLWGFEGKENSASDVRDPNAGYMEKGCFTIGLNISLVSPLNENLVVSTQGNPCVVTWQLRNLKEMVDSKIYSDEIRTANATWKLKLVHVETNKGGGFYGIYLVCTGSCATQVKLRVKVLNQRTEKRSISKGPLSFHCHAVLKEVSGGKELEHRFGKGTSNWGWHHFMETKVLQDEGLGFIDDGWSTLIACLSFKKINDQMKTATAARLQAQVLMLEKHAKLTGGKESETKKEDDASVDGELKAVGVHCKTNRKGVAAEDGGRSRVKKRGLAFCRIQ